MADEPIPPVPPVAPVAPPTSTEAQVVGALSAAVTGDGTPATATMTSKPDWKLAWVLALAGPFLSALIVLGAAAPVFIFWPDAVELKALTIMERIVVGLFTVIFALAACLALVIFRVAGGGLKSVSAKAGPAGINIETGGG